MVRPMEEEGLISRRTPDSDRRKVVVAITDKGRDLIRDHMAHSNAIFARIEAQYGKDRLETLLDLLDDLQRLDLRK
jgi:DNA-binding MarR family transcriptional regulator